MPRLNMDDEQLVNGILSVFPGIDKRAFGLPTHRTARFRLEIQKSSTQTSIYEFTSMSHVLLFAVQNPTVQKQFARLIYVSDDGLLVSLWKK